MAPSTRSTSPIGVTRARQGRSGRHVLLVLVFGLLLVVLGFTAAFLWKKGDFESANSNNGPSTAGRMYNTPEPAPINTQPDQKATPPETNHTAP